MDLYEFNQLWAGYKVDTSFCEKKIKEYELALKKLNEEIAILKDEAAKEGYVFHEKRGRWVYK